jgi:hypothetical protein
MLIFFKPQLGSGFDGGGIAGGYVIPTDKKSKKQARKRTLKKSAPLPVAVTPAVIVEAVEDRRTEELKERLAALSLDLEIELLRQAQIELEEQQKAASEEAERQAQYQYARELLSFMLEEAEREMAAERAEVMEILDILDDEGWRALDVHTYTKKKKR